MSRFYWFVLVLLLLGVANSHAGNDTDDDDDGKDKLCDNMIPGVEQIGCGVDITTLDLIPKYTPTQPYGFRREFVQFTCNNNQMWKHPGTGEEYQRPDQLSKVYAIPSGDLKYTSRFSDEMSDYKRELMVSAGLSVDFELYGSLSASASYRDAQEKFLEYNKSITEMSATVTSITADLALNLKFNPDFEAFINDSTPPKYENNPAHYDKFVKYFGTHYFTSASFGGHLYLWSEIDQYYARRTSEDEVKANVEASFKAIFKAKVDGEHKRDNVTEQYTKSSKTIASYFGGKPGLLPSLKRHGLVDRSHNSPDLYDDGNFMNDWITSVPENPWLMWGELANIEDLISNLAFKTELEKAIKVHRLKAYIEDVKRAISLGRLLLRKDEVDMIVKFKAALESRDLAEFKQMVDGLDGIFDGIQANRELANGDDIASEYHDEIIKGLYGLGIDITRHCADPGRVKLMQDAGGQANDILNSYQTNKANHKSRKEFITRAKFALEMFHGGKGGLCEFVEKDTEQFKLCCKCAVDEFDRIGNYHYRAFNDMIEKYKKKIQ